MICGRNPASSTYKELIARALNPNNHLKHKALVKALAYVPDKKLEESQTGRIFWVNLKRKTKTAIFWQLLFGSGKTVDDKETLGFDKTHKNCKNEQLKKTQLPWKRQQLRQKMTLR